MKKATFKVREAASIRRCCNMNNNASLLELQERYIRRRMQISHNQAKIIASLFWGGEID